MKKRKIENVALVYFPINDPGGILTWNKEIQKGFAALGVTTMYFYATAAERYTCDPESEIKKERYTQLPGYHLSYNAKYIKQTIEILNQFDLILFTKASPHPTKDNLKYKDIENWKLLYSDTKPPKAVVFHDALWFKTNEWSKDVCDHVNLCVAAQKKFIHSVVDYPADCIKYWDYFPVDFAPINKMKFHAKELSGMLATQWVKWKNHHKFLPVLPEIKVPMDIYGAGMEWHYLKKTKEYQLAINKDYKMLNEAGEPTVHNRRSIHTIWGHIKYEQLQEAYRKHLFSIDLSTRGYTNYTHFEPMCYRTLSFIERRVFNDPDNVIPDDCCLIYDLEMVARQLNVFQKMPTANEWKILNSTADRAQKFAQNMDCIKVAQRLIENLQKA